MLQLLKLPDGTVKVLVEGKARAAVLRFTSRDAYYEADSPSFSDDGKYLALASGVSGNIAQMQISGSTATVVNTTVLAGSGTIWQFWIPGVPKPKKQAQASSIIAPTDSSSGGFVGFWAYPAGGSPTKTITGFDQPDGVAVSTLKK